MRQRKLRFAISAAAAAGIMSVGTAWAAPTHIVLPNGKSITKVVHRGPAVAPTCGFWGKGCGPRR
jgi:hypothetical protein